MQFYMFLPVIVSSIIAAVQFFFLRLHCISPLLMLLSSKFQREDCLYTAFSSNTKSHNSETSKRSIVSEFLKESSAQEPPQQ